ncbi:hypothetical protein QVD17_19398 [Tagetes erecta]|uniref:Uncharacterized protein n=1 Tax=Tagetes erecta TaxID=13708 RepID=A0AAD8KMK0_TARER|nr:hypothetical protein QVD17_19398 [Tagetes erecta]
MAVVIVVVAVVSAQSSLSPAPHTSNGSKTDCQIWPPLKQKLITKGSETRSKIGDDGCSYGCGDGCRRHHLATNLTDPTPFSIPLRFVLRLMKMMVVVGVSSKCNGVTGLNCLLKQQST